MSLGSFSCGRQVHLCCIAHKKKCEKPIFRTNPRLEAPLPPFSLRTTFRNSAITPASPLIKKSTTLRLSRWCSHCSVAERQQFSCPLGTATSSLKLENVVLGSWICFFSYCGQVFFYCSSIDEHYSFFFYIYSSKTHSIFLSTSLWFLRHVSSRLRHRRH